VAGYAACLVGPLETVGIYEVLVAVGVVGAAEEEEGVEDVAVASRLRDLNSDRRGLRSASLFIFCENRRLEKNAMVEDRDSIEHQPGSFKTTRTGSHNECGRTEKLLNRGRSSSYDRLGRLPYILHLSGDIRHRRRGRKLSLQ
jgi:hypothetical protein